MIRSKFVAVASLMVLVLVTGCNNADQADEDLAPTPTIVRKKAKKPKAATPTATAEASPGKAKTATAGANTAAAKKPKAATPAKANASAGANAKQTLTKLNGYLPAAVKALQANDVDKAKQYAKSFSDNWQQKIIQNRVKTESQASYNKIAAGVTQVNNLMKPATPNNARAIEALESLSQAVSEYTKS